MYRGKPADVALSISAGALIQIYSLKGHLVSMSFMLGEIPLELPAQLFSLILTFTFLLMEKRKYHDSISHHKIPVFYLL